MESFRAFCTELRNVPDEVPLIINKKFSKSKLSELLASAMKALSIADTIIMKQADIVMQSSQAVLNGLPDIQRNGTRISCTDTESGACSDVSVFDPSISCKTTIDAKNDTKKFMPEKDVPTVKSPRTPTQPQREYSAAVKTVTTQLKNDAQDDIENSNDFQDVLHCRSRKKRNSKAIIGNRRGQVLGSCMRKLDVFLSRMGPDVSADDVEHFC